MKASEIDWPQYDHLKAQGHSGRRIAEAWGIPESTLRDAVKRRSALTPVQRPVHASDTGAVSSVDIGAVQSITAEVDQLKSDVRGLAEVVRSLVDRMDTPPASTPVQITALPSYPKAEAVRWNLWINKAIREKITTLAAKRDVPPSQLVQELLWRALHDMKDTMS